MAAASEKEAARIPCNFFARLLAHEIAHWLSQVRLEIANVNAHRQVALCSAVSESPLECPLEDRKLIGERRRTEILWLMAQLDEKRMWPPVAAIIGSEPLGTRLNSVQEPLEVFCIQVQALATMSARLRLAAHPSTA